MIATRDHVAVRGGAAGEPLPGRGHLYVHSAAAIVALARAVLVRREAERGDLGVGSQTDPHLHRGDGLGQGRPASVDLLPIGPVVFIEPAADLDLHRGTLGGDIRGDPVDGAVKRAPSAKRTSTSSLSTVDRPACQVTLVAA